MQKNESDWALTVLVIGISLGAVLWGGSYMVESLGVNIITPGIRAIRAYLINYGRGTAEVIAVVLIVGQHLLYHKKVILKTIEEFHSNVEKMKRECDSLKVELTSSNQKNEKLLLEIDGVKHDQFLLKSKSKELETEKESLLEEIEKLKNPEKFAINEKIQEQALYDPELINIIDLAAGG